MTDTYLWMKVLHIISFISWMAGLLYLPRLFVYHAQQKEGSKASETFKIMEHKLLRYIMNPAMVSTFVFGIILAFDLNAWAQGWLHAKIALVLAMAAMHGWMAKWRRDFALDRNRHSPRFFRFINEIPTVLMIAIVILAVMKPF